MSFVTNNYEYRLWYCYDMYSVRVLEYIHPGGHYFMYCSKYTGMENLEVVLNIDLRYEVSKSCKSIDTYHTFPSDNPRRRGHLLFTINYFLIIFFFFSSLFFIFSSRGFFLKKGNLKFLFFSPCNCFPPKPPSPPAPARPCKAPRTALKADRWRAYQ